MFKFLSLLLLIAFYSCTNPPYRGKDILGADEFVMDSYKIREGKFSILEMEGKCIEDLSCDLLEDSPDVIYEADVLNVMLYHPSRTDLGSTTSEISEKIGFKVEGGALFLPDIEPICVAGLSLEEAKQKIRETYNAQIKDVDVFLSYKDRLERKVELIGLVETPTIAVDGKKRLFEILALAKVPPSANFFKSYVVREDSLIPVDLYKLVKEGDMSQNIVMRGGDKIYIAEPSASTLMVLGEVGSERVIDVPDGFMSLRQAIGEAKGIAHSGDKSYIQIIRGNILHPKIYTLHWQHMMRLPSDSLLLIPGDIVYVAATPIAEWNRFVNQVLPTLIGVDLVLKGLKGVGVNVSP